MRRVYFIVQEHSPTCENRSGDCCVHKLILPPPSQTTGIYPSLREDLLAVVELFCLKVWYTYVADVLSVLFLPGQEQKEEDIDN